jgi:phenylalanyl-tRNA synthetase beta chain
MKSGRAVTVKIEDKDGADSIYIRTLDQVDVKRPTPIWMQRRIENVECDPFHLRWILQIM